MTWVERRAQLLATAVDEPGWGCVRRAGDRHIGRVVMVRERQWRAGFYRTDHALYAALAHYFGAKQRKATRELPR
jgi:hypothetical protein